MITGSETDMPGKSRILLLKEFLEANSDAQHTVDTQDIRKYLAKNGCPVTIQTLRTDIRTLLDHGYQIEITERDGYPTRYGWIRREWAEPELQILVDAVSSAQFITREKSGALIRKLSGMAGPSAREELNPQILISERIKAPNEQILEIVETIRGAIREGRKISFRYFQYNTGKKRVLKRDVNLEKRYTVSPYATIWNNDRYYLVCWSDTRQKVVTFRIDRMEAPRILEKKLVPAPGDFNIRDYTEKIFGMYAGTETEVILRCRHEIMDQVIDKFGEGVTVFDVSKEYFSIRVTVSASTTFYAWVFQFVGKMNIIGPEDVRDRYAEYLGEALDDVLGV